MTETPRGLIETYKRLDIEFVSGHGVTLVDSNGIEYIDLLGGIAVASVGHANPEVARAVGEQAGKLVMVSNFFRNQPMLELASRLYDLTGMLSFFGNSGAEAVECGLKLARKWARNNKQISDPRIIATEGAFHGRTFGALSATGQPAKRDIFAPMLPGFTHVPYGDSDALRAAMGEDVIAILVEPIQGEAGVIVPPDDYLPTARALCDEWGALLFLDEIQTGLGRTGAWFAHQHVGVKPDIMTLAKGMGGGLPIGACLATETVASAFAVGDHGTTFGGGPVPCTAALTVLDIIERDDLVERAKVLGERLKQGLRDTFPGQEVRGRGLMVAVEFEEEVGAELVAKAIEEHVIVNNASPRIVRMVPPLVITEEEIDTAIERLARAWSKVQPGS